MVDPHDDGMGERDRQPGTITARGALRMLTRWGRHLESCARNTDRTARCGCGLDGQLLKLMQGVINPTEDT